MAVTQEPSSEKPWLPSGNIQMSMLDLPTVALHATLRPCIRGLALHLMTNDSPYCNIGFFFKSLGDTEIDYLLDRYNAHEDEHPDSEAAHDFQATKELTLLTYLLGRAEGETDLTPEYIREALPMLGTLLKVEHYARKHGSKVNRMNYSLTTCNRTIVNSATAAEMQEYFKNF